VFSLAGSEVEFYRNREFEMEAPVCEMHLLLNNARQRTALALRSAGKESTWLLPKNA